MTPRTAARVLRVMAGLALLLAGAPTLSAQATAHVEPLHPVYRDIDRLLAAGLLRGAGVVTGQRPYTRREVRRLLDEASRAAAGAAWVDSIVVRWEEFAATEPGFVALAAVDFEVTALESPFRPIPPDTTGTIDASVNPLASFRQGRRYVHGQTLAVETRHRATLGRHFAVELAPRAMAGAGDPARPGGATSEIRLERAYVNASFGNLVITAGRDALFWGQGEQAGNLISHNAPPLDMVRFSTERPARLPGVLGRFARGPVGGTLFIADLGPHRKTPHSRLVGYKVTALPFAHVEASVQVLTEVGGHGAPTASLSDKILDVFIVYDLLSTKRELEISNKLAGMDFRIRFPQPWARGLEVYLDGALDDFDLRRLRSTFVEDGGYVWGALLSCLPECGRRRLRAEYRTTGLRFFQHTQFPSGIALRDQVIGDPLGPKGQGWYATWDAQLGPRRGALAVSGAWETRSGNVYGNGGTAPNDADFHFVILERHPTEFRRRTVVSWTSDPGARVRLRAQAGLEHVTNFAFELGAARWNMLARVGATVRP